MMLGHLLRRDRERRGLSLAQAAGRVGITVATLRRIEDEQEHPSFEVWDRLAEFYGWPRTFWPPRQPPN